MYLLLFWIKSFNNTYYNIYKLAHSFSFCKCFIKNVYQRHFTTTKREAIPLYGIASRFFQPARTEPCHRSARQPTSLLRCRR